jgi:hypothetical protein
MNGAIRELAGANLMVIWIVIFAGFAVIRLVKRHLDE